jgi:HD superfamily phosphohydrolase
VKRIFDPIHHFIELDDAEVALLDTPVVQRLRRLRQLGLASMAFPAAEHTRFGHVLGALAAGERVIDSLRRHDDAGYFANEADFALQRRLLRVSLLLHDVGHGPFSHASEAVLGQHEERTRAILGRPEIATALERLDVDPADVVSLVTGTPEPRFPVLKEIVSGPNLDADRMDYLLRDAYFTGIINGRYDSDQLIGALRVYDRGGGRVALGVDARGAVALESFVLARYMMFATVYFHHTTRVFERLLQEALREIWPHERPLADIDEFLGWDDFRVLEALRTAKGDAAYALRNREPLYGLAAEFNAERDLSRFETCVHALRERYGDAVWADAQEQLIHRLPLGVGDEAPTVLVGTRNGLLDARAASDLIAKLSGKAYWRKLFVKRTEVDLSEARRLCNDLLQ